MSNDLEAEIRDALHTRAIAVAAQDLVRRDESARPGRRPMLAALAAAAAIVALAIGIGVAAWPSSQKGKQPPATASVHVVGIEWQFVKGIQGTTNFTGASQRVEIAFYPNRQFGAYDGVNSISGRYQQTPVVLHIYAAFSTAVGYAGHDPNVLATQTAFAALTNGRSDIAAHVNDLGELVLTGPDYMLWFRNAGPADMPSETASPTSTGTATEAPASYINGSELPAPGPS